MIFSETSPFIYLHMNYVFLYLSLVFLFGTLNLHAQNMDNLVSGKVQYGYYVDTLAAKTKLESLKRENPKKFELLGKQVRQITKVSESLSFSLDFNESKSFFSIEELVLPEDPMAQMAYKSALVIALDAKEAYLIDYDDKSSSFFMNWMGTTIQVVGPFESPDWMITGERKFSNGRTLIEATASVQLPIYREGKKTLVRAFYDPSIPLPYGPAGYHGLPGLILELYLETEEPKGFIAANISLNGGASKEIKVPKVVAKITKEEFDKKVMSEARNK